jgi:hypothetical protein
MLYIRGSFEGVEHGDKFIPQYNLSLSLRWPTASIDESWISNEAATYPRAPSFWVRSAGIADRRGVTVRTGVTVGTWVTVGDGGS